MKQPTHALLLALSATLLGMTPIAALAEVAATPQEGVVWQDIDESFKIEWAPDGSMLRISAAFYQPVNFPDRRGIATAQIIAEEKAKARIVRYLSELSSSERKVREINAELETATRKQGNGSGESISKETVRKMETELQEFTRSYASGQLSGVIRLESGYDEKREEAWVRVGMSRKTMHAAKQLKSMLQGNPAGNAPEPMPGTDPAARLPQGYRQPSEFRQSMQRDW